MSQDLKALQVPQSTGKADSSQIDLTAAFNFTGTLQKSGTNLATTSDAASAAQSESNLRTAAAALSASLALNSQKITGLAAGESSNDAVNKGQLDSVAAGLDVKPSVKAATTANITLSGEQTIDGVSIVAGDRVLVKNQSTASQNGIYVASASSWARASDMAAASDAAGAFAFVEGGGTTNEGKGFVCTSDTGSAIVGTDALVFTQFSGGASYTQGNGIDITGGAISVVVDPAGPITVSSSGVNLQAASTSQPGSQSADHFDLTEALGGGGASGTLTSTDATPQTITMPTLATSKKRRVSVWLLVNNTSDLAKSLYREIVFIARRGSSGNTTFVGSNITAEIADNNGAADPSGMGSISLAYTPGTNGVDVLTFTGIASTNLSSAYGAHISDV